MTPYEVSQAEDKIRQDNDRYRRERQKRAANKIRGILMDLGSAVEIILSDDSTEDQKKEALREIQWHSTDRLVVCGSDTLSDLNGDDI